MIQIPNYIPLFEKHIVGKKANEVLSFCGALLTKPRYVSEKGYFETRNLAAIDLIKNTIMPTVGSEGDIIYWEQIIWEIENMGDARYIEYEEPEVILELEDRVSVGDDAEENFINEREEQKKFYETDLKIKAFELAQKIPCIVDSRDVTKISKEYIEAAEKIFDFIK